MRISTAKSFQQFDALLAQFEDEGRRVVDDPDFYQPALSPEGVCFCVRPSLAPSPAKRALGLSPLPNQRNRYGLDGASRNTRKKIKATGLVMNRFQGRVAFGAFTPSPEDFERIETAPGGVAGMQKRLTDEMTKAYKRVGREPAWLLVPEITPKLSASLGRPMIHWHIVAVNKRSRWDKGWWIDIQTWNDIYMRAFQTHCGRPPANARASVSLRQARNPARYLAKYLSKNPDQLGDVDFEGHEEAIPRQWFSRSKAAKRMVDELTLRLPSAFADFLWREWQVLESEDLGHWRTFVVNGRTGWEVGAFRFKSLTALALVWERFVAQLRACDTTDVGVPGLGDIVETTEHEGDFVGSSVDLASLQLKAQPVMHQLCCV